MRKLFFLLFTVLAVGSCKNEIENEGKSITVPNEKQLNQTVFADELLAGFNFITTGEWTFKVSDYNTGVLPKWITIEPNSNQAGNHILPINMEVNYTGKNRTAIISITCNKETVVVNITQDANTAYGKHPAKEVSSVSLNSKEVIITMGKTDTLKAIVMPSTAINKQVIWSSSDIKVATVSDKGIVSAHNTGMTTIEVTTLDGKKTATCNVLVLSGTPTGTGNIVLKELDENLTFLPMMVKQSLVKSRSGNMFVLNFEGQVKNNKEDYEDYIGNVEIQILVDTNAQTLPVGTYYCGDRKNNFAPFNSYYLHFKMNYSKGIIIITKSEEVYTISFDVRGRYESNINYYPGVFKGTYSGTITEDKSNSKPFFDTKTAVTVVSPK